MVPWFLCGHQCEPGQEDGEGGQGLRVSCLCGEGEAGEGGQGPQQVSQVPGTTASDQCCYRNLFGGLGEGWMGGWVGVTPQCGWAYQSFICVFDDRTARIGRREIVKENILKKRLGWPASSASSSGTTTPTDGTAAMPATMAAVATPPAVIPTTEPPSEMPSEHPADPKAPTKLDPPPTAQAQPPPSHTPPPAPPTASSHSSTTVRRRVSSTYSHGDPSEDQYGLSQLFQPDNAPKPVPTSSTSSTAESTASHPSAMREETGIVKAEGNTFRTKFKVDNI